MEQLAGLLDEFFLYAFGQSKAIDVRPLSKEFEARVRESCLIRPLFTMESSQLQTEPSEVKTGLGPNAFLCCTSNSTRAISSQDHNLLRSDPPIVTASNRPKCVGFIYPTKEEILMDIPSVATNRVSSHPVIAPTNDEWFLVKSTQEFEENVSSIHLTQLLATPGFPSEVPPSNMACEEGSQSSVLPKNGSQSLTTISNERLHRVLESAPLPTSLHPVFMTAGGQQLAVPSAEALHKARCLFNELPASSNSSPVIVSGADDESACTLSDARAKGVMDCASNSKTKVIGNSHLAIRTENMQANNPNFTGFMTAKGSAVNLSKSASKEKAVLLLASALHEDISSEHPDLKSGVTLTMEKQSVVASSSSFVQPLGNSPVSGKVVGTSYSNATSNCDILPVCPQLYNFVTASGQLLPPVSSKALERAKLLCSSDLEQAGETRSSESPSGHILETVPVSKPSSTGFMSASGHSLLPVSDSALTLARLLCSENQITAVESNERRTETTGVSGSKVTSHSYSFPVNFAVVSETNLKSVGFTKASGDALKPISKAALARARQMLCESSDANPSLSATDACSPGTPIFPTHALNQSAFLPERGVTTAKKISVNCFQVQSTMALNPQVASEWSPQHIDDPTMEPVTSVANPKLLMCVHATDSFGPVAAVTSFQPPCASSNSLVENSGVMDSAITRTDNPKLSTHVSHDLTELGADCTVESPQCTLTPLKGSSCSKAARNEEQTCSDHARLNADPLVRTSPPISAHSPPKSTSELSLSPPNEPDSLTSLMNDTQFQDSMRILLRNHGLEKTDPLLESQRQALRTQQQQVINQKRSFSHTSLLKRATVDKRSSKAVLPVKSDVSCPGLLWRLRCAWNRTQTSTDARRSILTSLHHLLENCSPKKNLDENATCSVQYFMPDYVHFPVDQGKWCMRTAGQLRWLMDSVRTEDYSGTPIPLSYEVGDGMTLIPDDYGCVGKEEVINAFLACPSVCCQLASSDWVSNHYDQLVWKMGSTTMRWSATASDETIVSEPIRDQLPPNYFTPHHVLLRMKYRYDRELDHAERPALRRIAEMDDTPARRLVLCVCELSVTGDKRIQMRLTDGWYQIHCQLDEALSRLIRSGRIRVGSKLVTACAELVPNETPVESNATVRPAHRKRPGGEIQTSFDHLLGADGAVVGLMLRLHGNATRPVPWFTRLGYVYSKQPKSGCGLYPVPLCTLQPDGGVCPAIRVVIQRRFSLQYMETLDSCSDQKAGAGQHNATGHAGKPDIGSGSRRFIFRSERAEQAELDNYENQRRRALDNVLDGLLPNARGARRNQPSRTELASLGNDGEALLAAVMGAPDPGDAESELTDAQREAIRQYKEAAVRSAVAEVTPCRKVTRLLRIRVAGLHPKDVSLNYVVPLTFWNPSDDLLALVKEGEPVEIYKLQASTTRTSDPFVPHSHRSSLPPEQQEALPPGTVLSLSGGRNTYLRPLVSSLHATANCDPSDVVDAKLISQVYQPRRVLCVTDLSQLCAADQFDFCVPLKDAEHDPVLEVDLSCVVVTVLSSAIATTPLRTRSDSKNVTNDPREFSPRGGIRQFRASSNSEVDSVYVTDATSRTDESLAVVKIWNGVQAQHLGNVLKKGQHVLFTCLQLRRRQHRSSIPVLDPELGTRSYPLVSLNYSVASNVSVDNSHPPIPRSYQSKEGVGGSGQTAFYLNRLESLIQLHLSSYRTPTNKPSLVQTRLGELTQYSTPLSRNRFGLGLSDLLQPATGSVGGSKNTTPVTQSSTLRTHTLPIQSVPLESEAEPEQQITPIRHLFARTTPRTGLSRRGRRRCTIQLGGPSRDSAPTAGAPVTPAPDNTKTPMHSVDNLPLFVALTDGQLTSTPEPKLKRRRSSTYSQASYLEEAEKENRLDALDSMELPPENTSNTLKSPVCMSSTTVSNQQFDLPTHSWNVNDSRSASSGHESTDDLDVSIADLVKTRRRQSTPRLFPASSTPTRNSLPRFTS